MATGLRRGEEAAVPSSMIFASLVVLWLLILVPAVARHRQEVARPSVAALSGRVLARSPRRRSQEVGGMGERETDDVRDDGLVVATRVREDSVPAARTEPRVETVPEDDQHSSDADEVVDEAADEAGDEAAGSDGEFDGEVPDDRVWERPPPRYRAGRGGFDAEAAALAARARYAFRQRVVLAMLFAALITGVVAAVAVPGMWWPHAAVDVMLVGYLIYLRRQVRMEEAIRARRAARMAGTRHPCAADDPELDEWAERGREAVRQSAVDDVEEGVDEVSEEIREGVTEAPEHPAPVAEEEQAALPRLRPTPPPPLPAGTALVEAEEDDLELDDGEAPGYRRAAGQ